MYVSAIPHGMTSLIGSSLTLLAGAADSCPGARPEYHVWRAGAPGMASAGARAYNGGLGQKPGQEVRGFAP